MQGEKHEDRVTLIAIEVGEVRANKPIEAFMSPRLRELWVYPYSGEGDWLYEYPREGDHYYIFRRGARWVKVSRRLHEEEMRQLKSVVSLLEEDEALLARARR